MKKFKHSGAFGDLIYSLPIVKYFGGGEFFLHLDQINWIGQHYYGSPPDPVHRGRLTHADFEFMKSFMERQEYISKFDILTAKTEITHNLDKFRVPFVGHPGNYVDVYSTVFGITNKAEQSVLRNTPWLTADPHIIDGRTVVINRTQRWIPGTLSNQWQAWRETGMEEKSIFVGLPEEYELFKKATNYNIPYHPTKTMLDLAAVIAGSELYIGNQSVGLALAIGLGKTINCEARQDLPMERNECHFPNREDISYF